MNIVIKNRRAEVEHILEHSNSLSIMGIPGGGISVFLKQLASSDIGQSIYLDTFALPSLSSLELFRALAHELGIKNPGQNISEIVEKSTSVLKQKSADKRVIIYFAGFDQLASALDADLLQGLQALARSNGNKVKLVFGLCISLKKLIPDAHFDSGLRVFGTKYYLGSYSDAELRYLLDLYGPAGWEKLADLKEKLDLSGGHLQLLLLLLNEKQTVSDGLNDSVNQLFKNIYGLLLGPQRTIVRSISMHKRTIAHDEYLNGIGIVKESGKLFSPLFATYLSGAYKARLPAKEQRLLLVLKRSLGQVVSKQEIIDKVWQGEIVSDWALNALVYRLRKHPAFIARGYSLDSYKKQGYSLNKQ